MSCGAHHGLHNPRKLVIACKCTDCDGELRGYGISSTQGGPGFLICSMCRCVYEIAANAQVPFASKEVSR